MRAEMRLAASLLLAGLMATACGSRGGKELCEAIQRDDLAAVEELLALGSDPNETVTFRGNRTTPWREAVSQLGLPTEEREAIALAVLGAGGDPNLRWKTAGQSGYPIGGSDGNPYWYALEVAARQGSARVVEAIIDAGADVAGNAGGQALIAAARYGHVDILRILIDSGTPMNFKNLYGITPLGAAVEGAPGEGAAREAIEYLESIGAREW